ncbi:MAG: hypothetical protein HY826_04815 [Actinobacteria bacterium]|nr:hypothetical protein [Actinomycetota bacterium]
MARKVETENVAGDRLEIVKRGYDPYQVQRLVSALSTELKELADENDALRSRLNETPARRDANGHIIERRAQGSSPAERATNAELRENLRWARAALDDILGQLSNKTSPRPAEQSRH